jgi:hypothetical protein
LLKPKTISRVIIDADIIAYRAAAANDSYPDPLYNNQYHKNFIKVDNPETYKIIGSYQGTIDAVETLMNYVIAETVAFPEEGNVECYLTGSNNFRYDVAKYVPYKGNRSLKVKPVHLQEARDYLVRKWGAVISEGEEADDLIGIASSFGSPDTTVVCTIDKDMLQLPCWHFNFVRGTWVRVSVDEGNKFFYTQILTGDAADNIKGIYRVGPVKAGKILKGLTTEGEMYEACVQAYATSDEALKANPDCWIEYGKARVLENARLLWLRRYVGQMWEPPE